MKSELENIKKGIAQNRPSFSLKTNRNLQQLVSCFITSEVAKFFSSAEVCVGTIFPPKEESTRSQSWIGNGWKINMFHNKKHIFVKNKIKPKKTLRSSFPVG